MSEAEPDGEPVPFSMADGNAASSDDSVVWTPSANVSKTGKTRVTANVSKAPFAVPKTAKPKPRKITGFYWVVSGTGWKLHGSKRVDGKNPLVGYLSAADYKELKRRFKGEELTEKLFQQATEKGIEL